MPWEDCYFAHTDDNRFTNTNTNRWFGIKDDSERDFSSKGIAIGAVRREIGGAGLGFGKRPYLHTDYHEMIKSTTDKEAFDRMAAGGYFPGRSLLERPYGSRHYQEMKYQKPVAPLLAETPPDLQLIRPEFEIPEIPGVPDMGRPMHIYGHICIRGVSRIKICTENDADTAIEVFDKNTERYTKEALIQSNLVSIYVYNIIQVRQTSPYVYVFIFDSSTSTWRLPTAAEGGLAANPIEAIPGRFVWIKTACAASASLVYDDSAQTSDDGRGRRIARTSDGNLHCVFTDYVVVNFLSRGQIMYGKSTDAGATWATTQLTSGSYHQVYPTIAVDSNDYIHVAWTGKHAASTTYSQLRYRKYTTSWQTIENLTSDSFNNYSPAIAVDSSDNIHIAFNSYVTNFNIRYIKNTGSWQAIENITTGAYLQYQNPTLAIDSSGYIHVVWTGYTAADQSAYQLRYRKYTTSWQAVEELTTGSVACSTPAIAINSSDHIHIVWSISGAIKHIKNTGSWQTAETLPSTGCSVVSAPTISIDENDYIDVLYHGKFTGYPDYRLILHNLYTTAWGDAKVGHNIAATNIEIPGSLWAKYPATNIPASGYAALFRVNTPGYSSDNLYYIADYYLAWS